MGIKIGTRPVVRRYVGSREVIATFRGDQNLYQSGLGYLFGAGEQGVWYDPSDFARYMLADGPELVTNGDNEFAIFSMSGLSVANTTVTQGASPNGTGLVALATSSTSASAAHKVVSQASFFSAGKAYQISIDVYVPSGGIGIMKMYDNGDGSWFGDSTTLKDQWVRLTSVRLGKSSAWQIGFGNNIAEVVAGGSPAFYIDNISVKELTKINTATMFQDAAGTTPVTAMGQPVGLMLDKRLGLVRGPELCTDPTMSTPALWQFSGTAPLWGVSGGKGGVTETAAGNRWLINGNPLTIGKVYEITADVVVTAGSMAPDIGGTGLDVTTSGPKRWVTTATLSALTFVGRGSFIGSIDNISVRELPGNHATQPTAINRPVLRIDGTGRYYLAFNGTNSWMSTPAIDFTATDKMTVVAGVKKLSDANSGLVIELSVDGGLNNGIMSLLGPSSAAGNNYYFRTKGTIAASVSAGTISSPSLDVLTGIGDISGDQSSIRKNGLPVSSIATDQGTGNYGAYPAYIGARAGSTQFFNGNLYGLVVRGALSTASQITGAENFMNVKTGAY